MSPLKLKPVVLLTNDDGPPSASSPNIYSFARCLQERLGWEIRVVIPDSQKSWVGKAYAISDIIKGQYFYPKGPDGLQGEISTKKRPLKDGETTEWVLLSGTPATCANIALHNLYPGEIDLVISGPNHGRNSSAAFALSSGTIGASLSSALSRYPSIALSYGVVTRPVSQTCIDLANEASVEVVKRLWHDWGSDPTSPHEGRVQLYCINLPLVDKHLEQGQRKVVWTRLARNGYGSLFKKKDRHSVLSNDWDAKKTTAGAAAAASGAGPAAAPEANSSKEKQIVDDEEDDTLCFHFAPDMKPLVFPAEDQLVEGTDSWALHYGYISVTPMQASFAEPGVDSMRFGSEDQQKTKGDASEREGGGGVGIPGLWSEV